MFKTHGIALLIIIFSSVSFAEENDGRAKQIQFGDLSQDYKDRLAEADRIGRIMDGPGERPPSTPNLPDIPNPRPYVGGCGTPPFPQVRCFGITGEL